MKPLVEAYYIHHSKGGIRISPYLGDREGNDRRLKLKLRMGRKSAQFPAFRLKSYPMFDRLLAKTVDHYNFDHTREWNY